MSYYSISHHHLANHLIYLSSSSSFWFSLNSSYDHEFHLSKRLGMSPQDYEYLLMALDLARMDKRWGFSIMVMKWKVFLEGYLFSTINCDCDGTFEVDRKKMDIDAFIQGESSNKRKDIAFIRIGVLHAKSPRKIEMQKDSDGRMIVTPPRLNGLRIKQQSFRQCVEQSKWNYFLDNASEEGNDDRVEDDDEDDDNKDDDDDDENGTSSQYESKNKKPKYNAPGDDDDSMDNFDMAKSYPHLARALGGEDGFDPTNPSVRRSMHCLLTELNDLLSTTYELNVSDMSYKKISYVRVPRTSSDRSFQNSKEWVDTAIQIAGSKHAGTYEAAYRIANHLLRFYRDSVLAACENQRVPICKEMSATQFQAMLCAAKVTGAGETEMGRGRGACYPTQRLIRCACTFGRYMSCGMEHLL
jgi:hypothetical protein